MTKTLYRIDPVENEEFRYGKAVVWFDIKTDKRKIKQNIHCLTKSEILEHYLVLWGDVKPTECDSPAHIKSALQIMEKREAKNPDH